jgi:hypothetical protein
MWRGLIGPSGGRLGRAATRALPALFMAAGALGAQQDTRPRPYPVILPPSFEAAVRNGTRTFSGRPGPAYWTNYAHYTIRAELNPSTRTLTGTQTVVYHNRSPNDIPGMVLKLRQNLHRESVVRNRFVPLTGGVHLSRVVVAGQELGPIDSAEDAPGYQEDGTNLIVLLPEPLTPGGEVTLETSWSYVVPPDGAPRNGTDGEVFYMAYWYPQLAVYDDVHGWDVDYYMGNAEFYMGYGDYDVELTVPAGWLIGATGALQNADEVLTPQTRMRLTQAGMTRDVVHVVTEQDRGYSPNDRDALFHATRAGTNGRLTWRFQAENVRDFAWGTSDRYLWDATSAIAGDHDGDGRPDTTMIHTFYRPERVQWAWDGSARFVQHSVEFLSSYLWPYPWPHMTAMDGVVSCSGMEYPMMTCIGGQRDTVSLYSVLVHETAHMWFPMMVGSNEKAHSWQDEGLTRFNQNQAMRDFFDGMDRETPTRDNYLNFARSGGEHELMRHGDLYPVGTPAFGIASYDKMATILVALRALLGEDTFMRAYREYANRWSYRHPTPWDLFNTFEDVSGRDLDWFWTPWFHETWTLDQAVAEVRDESGETLITIEDRGLAPMPARVSVTRADGAVEQIEVPVDVWLAGNRRHTLRVAASPAVTAVEIDAARAFPDIDRDNNRWQR